MLISSCTHFTENGIVSFYGWVIFYCIYCTTSSLSIHFWWTFRLFIMVHYISLFMVLFYFMKIFNKYFAYMFTYILYSCSYAGVQPQQDPGAPSGWTVSVRERHVGLALIGPSLLGREREKERKRPDQEYATESGSCFIFDRSLYTLSWYISKGQISIQI